MGYTGTVTLRGVWGYGPEVDRTLGQVHGVEVGAGAGAGTLQIVASLNRWFQVATVYGSVGPILRLPREDGSLAVFWF